MASAFGHALSSYAIATCFPKDKRDWATVVILCIICSIIPDADVVAFNFGVPYEHPLGHRGFTHSIFFALILGLLVRSLFFRHVPRNSRRGWLLILLFFLCTVSHGLLDAMTTGGRGIAFFGPFDNTRYFLPWRFIKVSPLSAARFFSERGWMVIKSEAIWIGIPSLVIILINKIRRRMTST